jgi:hypothetical protein
MPVEVKKYTCQFRCGKKASGNINSVSGHEKACWNNPDNKTCKTCCNEVYEHDSDGFKSWTNRGCKIPVIDNVFSDLSEELQGTNSRHIRPIYQCPFHNINIKEVSPVESETFVEDLRSQITADYSTIHFPYHNRIKKGVAEESPENFPF